MGAADFGYKGKRVLIVGGASGMGAAAAKVAADLGADIIVMDVAEVTFPAAQVIKVDLRDKESVNAACDAITGPIDAVFSCAGVADGTNGLMLINYISQRHIIDRLINTGVVGRGAAIVMISSVAGLGWQPNLAQMLEVIGASDWESCVAWLDANPGNDHYLFSKMAINTYVSHEAFALSQKGIRINAILPGPTDTPLARANADTWLTFGEEFRKAASVETLVPEQIANTLAFLCSDAASGVNGIIMIVDGGHVSSAITGSFDEPLVKLLMGIA